MGTLEISESNLKNKTMLLNTNQLDASVQTLYNNAMMLNFSERTHLVQLLLKSMENTQDEEIDSIWLATARKRLLEITNHSVKPVTWETIKNRVKNDRLSLF